MPTICLKCTLILKQDASQLQNNLLNWSTKLMLPFVTYYLYAFSSVGSVLLCNFFTSCVVL